MLRAFSREKKESTELSITIECYRFEGKEESAELSITIGCYPLRGKGTELSITRSNVTCLGGKSALVRIVPQFLEYARARLPVELGVSCAVGDRFLLTTTPDERLIKGSGQHRRVSLSDHRRPPNRNRSGGPTINLSGPGATANDRGPAGTDH